MKAEARMKKELIAKDALLEQFLRDDALLTLERLRLDPKLGIKNSINVEVISDAILNEIIIGNYNFNSEISNEKEKVYTSITFLYAHWNRNIEKTSKNKPATKLPVSSMKKTRMEYLTRENHQSKDDVFLLYTLKKRTFFLRRFPEKNR